MRNKNMSIKLMLLILNMLIVLLIYRELQNYFLFSENISFIPPSINRDMVLNIFTTSVYILLGVLLFSIIKNINKNNSLGPIILLSALILFGLSSYLINYSKYLKFLDILVSRILILLPILGTILGAISAKLFSTNKRKK